MILGKGPGLALIAAATWGAGDFSGGLASRRAAPFHVVSIAYSLSLTGIVIAGLTLHAGLPTHRQALEALIAGVAGGFALICFYEALSIGAMGLTAAVSGVLTAAIPVLASFFLEGLPRPTQLAGFAAAALAIWLVAWAPSGHAHPRALALATLAGLGFGIFLLGFKLSTASGLCWPLACARAGSLFVALTMSLAHYLRQRSRPASSPVPPASRWQGWPRVLPIAALAGLFDTLGNTFYALAGQAGRMDVAAALSSLYPAATILLAITLLHERPTRTQLTGMALALVAVVLISS